MTSDEVKKLELPLWQTADTLRANSDLKSTEYSTPVLGLIFLKFEALFRKKSEKLYELIFEYASKGSKWAA